jgi:hypothetical protein
VTDGADASPGAGAGGLMWPAVFPVPLATTCGPGPGGTVR